MIDKPATIGGHCFTCEHYTPPTNMDFSPGGYCRLGETNYGDLDHPEAKAYALDHESYHAYLRVLPTFGCVQWFPKGESEGD